MAPPLRTAILSAALTLSSLSAALTPTVAPATEAPAAATFIDSLRISPSLLLEMDGRGYEHSVEGKNGFLLRRLRLGVHLVAGEAAEAVARLEYLSDSTEHVQVYDAFAEVRFLGSFRASM